MSDTSLSNFMAAALEAMSVWEILAVVLGVFYLVLAMKERIECWYAAFVSTAIYSVLFWDVNLLMESALQIYYLLMAVFGWHQWRKKSDQQNDLLIHTWSLKNHLMVLLSLIVLVGLSGYFLAANTSAAWPYVDSFTTWGSVITTYMVARKVLENWLYWLVIDSVSIFLYFDRELYLTALLFALYVVLVIIGFYQWRREYQQQMQIKLQRQPLACPV